MKRKAEELNGDEEEDELEFEPKRAKSANDGLPDVAGAVSVSRVFSKPLKMPGADEIQTRYVFISNAFAELSKRNLLVVPKTRAVGPVEPVVAGPSKGAGWSETGCERNGTGDEVVGDDKEVEISETLVRYLKRVDFGKGDGRVGKVGLLLVCCEI